MEKSPGITEDQVLDALRSGAGNAQELLGGLMEEWQKEVGPTFEDQEKHELRKALLYQKIGNEEAVNETLETLVDRVYDQGGGSWDEAFDRVEQLWKEAKEQN